MIKKEWEDKIKEIEDSIKTSKNNKEKAENHIEEGEIILKAFKDKIQTFNSYPVYRIT